MVKFNIKISQYFSVFSTLILSYLLFLIPSVKSQNNKEITNFNQTLIQYNNTKFLLDDISKKMENITLNIFLRTRLRELIKKHKQIEEQMSEIQKNLYNESYDKEKMKENIFDLNHKMHIFERKYNKTNKLFYETEGLKQSLINYVKMFFIILAIISIVVIIIIGVVSYFVIKHQKKYYKLQEEVSFNMEVKQNYEKRPDSEENSSNSDNRFKSNREDMNKKVVIKTNGDEPSSKEVFNQQNSEGL